MTLQMSMKYHPGLKWSDYRNAARQVNTMKVVFL
jgi:hypothetical protein